MKIEYLEKLNFLEIDNIEDLKTSRGTVEFFEKSEKEFGLSSKITSPDLRYYWDGERFGLHVSKGDYTYDDLSNFFNKNIGLLHMIKILYLGGTSTRKFTPLKSDLPNLEFLYLSENMRLNQISCEYLPNLKILIASNCPELIDIKFEGSYQKLEYLDLSMCNLQTINFEHSRFPSLKNINLCGNPLRKKLPFALLNTGSLQFVYGVKGISGIDDRYFDSNDLNVKKLFAAQHIIELQNEINIERDLNNIIDLTEEQYILDIHYNISFLDLGHINLKKIPAKLLEIPTLEHLCLGAYYPNKIGKYQNISWQESYFHKKTRANHNSLTSVEFEKLSTLPNLKSLYLNSINLDSIEFVSKLTNLRSLDISGNTSVKSLEPLKSLKSLELFHASHILNLENKELLFIPKSVISLSLEGCGITKINFIEQFKKAEYIYLQGNKITTEELFNYLITNEKKVKNEILPLIKTSNDGAPGIFVSNNLFDEALFSVLDYKDFERKRDSLEVYFANVIKEDEIQFTQIKLVLIGNTKAGKTTLFDIFNKEVKGYKIKSIGKSTHGLNIGAIEFLDEKNNLDFLLKIYDFGGQDYYHSTHWPYFSTDNTQYVLIFRNDCDDKFDIFESDGIKEMIFPMNYWLDSIIGMKNQVNNYSTNSNDQINLHLLQNCYHFPPTDLNLKNIKTKYRNHLNIEVLKPTLLRGVLENHRDNNYESYKKYLVQTIRQKTRNYTVIPKSRYDFINQLKQNPKGLIRKNTVAFSNKSKEWLDLSMDLAHNTYDFICRKEEKLKDFVITDISKFNEYIFTILKKEKDGYFTQEDAKSRLKKFNLDEFEIQYILNFMELNKIIFNIKKSENYLAPAFLDDKLTEAEEILVRTFNKPLIRYEFHSYFHSNLFTEIVIKFSEDSTLLEDGWKYVLKKGYVFLYDSSDNNNLLHIKYELREIPTITVFNHSIFGVNEEFVEEIHKALDKIVEYDIEKLDKVKKTVYNKYHHPVDFSILKKGAIYSQEGIKTDLLISNNRLLRKGDFRVFLEKEERNQLQMKKIFISYSKFDESYKDEFISHLITLKRQDLVETFDDRNIELGDKFDPVIKQKIQECDYFICLVSRHFLNVDYIIEEEIPEALRHNKRVIPVIIKPCDWYSMPFLTDNTIDSKFGDFNAYNKASIITLRPEFNVRDKMGNLQIKEFTDVERDLMWLNVINQLRKLIENDTNGLNPTNSPTPPNELISGAD